MIKTKYNDSIRKYLTIDDTISTVILLRHSDAQKNNIVAVVDDECDGQLRSMIESAMVPVAYSFQGGLGVKSTVEYFNSQFVFGITPEKRFVDKRNVFGQSIFDKSKCESGSLVEKIKAYKVLLDIAKLDDNWNDNGAKKFSKKLVRQAEKILDVLPMPPFIAPTARNSIQMEYEKGNGEYLELEIYENVVMVFKINAEYDEVEYAIKQKNKYDNIKRLVEEFYGIK